MNKSEQISKAFDAGFNISNEKFNAEMRDDYDMFDDSHYRELRRKLIKEITK
jgi:hypothetical protein